MGKHAGRGLGVIGVTSLGLSHKLCSDVFLFDSSRGSGRENSTAMGNGLQPSQDIQVKIPERSVVLVLDGILR